MKVNDQHSVPFELIAKYLANEVNDAEREIVMEWILENEEEFERMVQSWEHTERALKSPFIDVDNAWQKVQAQMSVSTTTRKNTLLLWKQPWRIAAAILMFFVLGWAILNFFAPNIFSQTQTAHARIDTLNIQLTDGSEIALNTDTKLSYPKKFSKENREVHLSGEAFFEIERDENKPFIVKTEDIQIKVLGTSFNVDAREQSDSISVTVKTGLVEVSVMNQTMKVDTIHAGEQIVYSKSKENLSSPTSSKVDFMKWKTGELDFHHKTMAEVAIELEKIYNVQIVVDPKIQNCEVGTSLDPNDYDIQQALEVLEGLYGYKIEIDQKVYKLLVGDRSCP